MSDRADDPDRPGLSPTDPSPTDPSQDDRGRAWDFYQLTKPRITFLVAVTAAMGFVLGSRAEIDWPRLVWTVVGTALVSAGASALNHHGERHLDAKMERTRDRPLPAGRLSPGWAMALGVSAGSFGVLALWFWVNTLTAGLAVLAFVSYVWVYTPLKRVSSLATLVGAVPGALPPVMGWTAARGALGAGAWALFAILFLWQLPHFLAIAWLCRHDYARAGFPMLPVIHPDGKSTSRQALMYAVALLPVSLLPTALGLAGSGYLLGALALGAVFLAATVSFARAPERASARRLMLVSVLYLPALFAGLLLDRLT